MTTVCVSATIILYIISIQSKTHYHCIIVCILLITELDLFLNNAFKRHVVLRRMTMLCWKRTQSQHMVGIYSYNTRSMIVLYMYHTMYIYYTVLQ